MSLVEDLATRDKSVEYICCKCPERNRLMTLLDGLSVC